MSRIQPERSRRRDESTETSNEARRSERSEQARHRAELLHGAADEAIREALSGNSQRFLDQNPQQGGQ